MLKKLGLVLLLSTALAWPAGAGCVMFQAMGNIENGYVQIRGNNAKKMQPVLDEFEHLGGPNLRPNIPIGTQLSPQDLRRFDELRFEILKIRTRDMVLSAYVRDMRLIAKLTEIARNITLQGRDYKDGNPDAAYAQLLMLVFAATAADPTPKAQPSKDDCSIDAALWGEQKMMLDNPTNDSKQYVLVLEALRTFNRMSETVYATHRREVEQATSEEWLNKHLGDEWEARVKAGGDYMKHINDLVLFITKNFPSDSAIETQHMSDEAKKVQ